MDGKLKLSATPNEVSRRGGAWLHPSPQGGDKLRPYAYKSVMKYEVVHEFALGIFFNQL
jgi:hypothetical protein